MPSRLYTHSSIRRLLRVDAGVSLANSPRPLRIGPTQALNATCEINPSPWNGTQTAVVVCLRIPAEFYERHYARICVDSFAQFGLRTAYGV